MECYTCLRELLPVVESALAAHGFVNESLLQREASGATLTVMTQGATTILLREDPRRDMADIEVYDTAHPEVSELCETLPKLLSDDRSMHNTPRRGAWRTRIRR